MIGRCGHPSTPKSKSTRGSALLNSHSRVNRPRAPTPHLRVAYAAIDVGHAPPAVRHASTAVVVCPSNARHPPRLRPSAGDPPLCKPKPRSRGPEGTGCCAALPRRVAAAKRTRETGCCVQGLGAGKGCR